MTGLDHGEGSHAQAREPSGSRVARDVVRRTRRAGQDELPDRPAIVDLTSDRVPEIGDRLPLVEETRHASAKDELGIRQSKLTVLHVAVEEDLTLG